MAKYRIVHKYPCYANGGCIPHDGYFVQKLEKGFFADKWVDIKGFGDRERAEELLKILKSSNYENNK
jgi:hypothetical protein